MVWHIKREYAYFGLSCRQVLGLRRQNHHYEQQATALQEELDAIMAVDMDDDTALLQQAHQQAAAAAGAGSRPHSAAVNALKARPMTAGPTHSMQQQQQQCQQADHWRPLSGSPGRCGTADRSGRNQQGGLLSSSCVSGSNSPPGVMTRRCNTLQLQYKLYCGLDWGPPAAQDMCRSSLSLELKHIRGCCAYHVMTLIYSGPYTLHMSYLSWHSSGSYHRP